MSIKRLLKIITFLVFFMTPLVLSDEFDQVIPNVLSFICCFSTFVLSQVASILILKLMIRYNYKDVRFIYANAVTGACLGLAICFVLKIYNSIR